MIKLHVFCINLWAHNSLGKLYKKLSANILGIYAYECPYSAEVPMAASKYQSMPQKLFVKKKIWYQNVIHDDFI